MSQTCTRHPVTPGPSGCANDRSFQLPSLYCAWPEAAPDRTRETVCAHIYFATNEHVLGPDDLHVVEAVGTILSHLHEVGYSFECICRGSADVRSEPGYNFGLSLRRAEAVAHELRPRLPASCGSLIRVEPLGESRARLDPSFWAEDRRVDIVVKCRPARLHRPSVAFEPAADHECEWIFLAGLTRKEIEADGCVKAWSREEMAACRHELLLKARTTWGGKSPVVQRLAAMTQDEFSAEMRSRVSACIRVTYRFMLASRTHRVSPTILDAISQRPLFPEVSVEAQVLIDGRGTGYLSSPEGSTTQVWRHLSPGQQLPAGARTRQNTTSAVGLTARPTDLFNQLRAGFPSITQRVASVLTPP